MYSGMVRLFSQLKILEVIYFNVTSVPTREEIGVVIELLDEIGTPLLIKIESLLENRPTWDTVARNDFVRSVLLPLYPLLDSHIF